MLSGNEPLSELMLTKFYMPHCMPPVNLDWNVIHGAVSMREWRSTGRKFVCNPAFFLISWCTIGIRYKLIHQNLSDICQQWFWIIVHKIFLGYKINNQTKYLLRTYHRWHDQRCPFPPGNIYDVENNQLECIVKLHKLHCAKAWKFCKNNVLYHGCWCHEPLFL